MSPYVKFDLNATMHTQEVSPATFATFATQQEKSSKSSESSNTSPLETRSTSTTATPCPHVHIGARTDGTRVCLGCEAVCLNGVWTPQTISYCTAAHVPYDPTPTDGPTRQCRHCPHVLRLPCGCGATAWQFDWPNDQVVWTCKSCGVRNTAGDAREEVHEAALVVRGNEAKE